MSNFASKLFTCCFGETQETPIQNELLETNLHDTLNKIHKSLAIMKKSIEQIDYEKRSVPNHVVEKLDENLPIVQQGFLFIEKNKDAFLNTATRRQKHNFKLKFYNAKTYYQGMVHGDIFGFRTPVAKINSELRCFGAEGVRNIIMYKSFERYDKAVKLGKEIGKAASNQLQYSVQLMINGYTTVVTGPGLPDDYNHKLGLQIIYDRKFAEQQKKNLDACGPKM